MIRTLSAALALCALTAQVRLHADEQSQPQPPKGYVQIGPLLIVQPPGIANHRVHPALSGHAPGVTTSVGAFVTSTLAIEGEFVWAGTISTAQVFSYTWREDYTAENRDVLLNLNLRWHPGRQRYVEIFGGGGLAISTFANRSIVETQTFPARTSTQPDEEMTSRHPTLGVGVAGVVPMGRAVALVPRVGIRWVKRPADSLGIGGYMGAFSTAWQVGAALRFSVGGAR